MEDNMNRVSRIAPALAGLLLAFAAAPGQAQICVTSDNNNANTACGTNADNSDSGYNNAAFGYHALNSNTGGDNTAGGAYALDSNTTGLQNTAGGKAALYSNTTGSDNTATGYRALYSNTEGGNNTAIGEEALYGNTGGDNSALGYEAGYGNTTGLANTFIGYQARPNAGAYRNGTALGNGAVVTASNSIVLGNASITKIYAKVTSITAISDRRLKKDIAALDPALGLAFIEKLKPVSYRFKNGDETQRYGFIAQDLEQALPAALHDTVETSQPEHGLALVERQNDADRTYRVAYGELTAPMVKAIQEQQQEIAALKSENGELRRSIAAIRKQVGPMTAAHTPRRIAKAAATREATARR
jgi:trimeric autotransporter adhesin